MQGNKFYNIGSNKRANSFRINITRKISNSRIEGQGYKNAKVTVSKIKENI